MGVGESGRVALNLGVSAAVVVWGNRFYPVTVSQCGMRMMSI